RGKDHLGQDGWIITSPLVKQRPDDESTDSEDQQQREKLDRLLKHPIDQHQKKRYSGDNGFPPQKFHLLLTEELKARRYQHHHDAEEDEGWKYVQCGRFHWNKAPVYNRLDRIPMHPDAPQHADGSSPGHLQR